jgi:hypothetical protein
MSENPDHLNAADTEPDGGRADGSRWVRRPEGEDPRQIDREHSDPQAAAVLTADRHVSHAEKDPRGFDPADRDQDPDA